MIIKSKISSLLFIALHLIRCRNVAPFNQPNVASRKHFSDTSVKLNSMSRLQPLRSVGRYRRRTLVLSASDKSQESMMNVIRHEHIDDIENVYVISDLHTDNMANLEWLKQRCNDRTMHQTPRRNDALIIAGDISHELSIIEETFTIILEGLSCHVFFVWGNHEAWIGGQEMDALGIESSLEKIDAVKQLCKKMGVRTEFELVGKSHDNPVCILPIESWYDGTLALNGCEDLCTKFKYWPWVDFKRCSWPDQDSLIQLCKSNEKAEFSICNKNIENIGRIPLGLTNWFALKNKDSISAVQDIYLNLKSNEQQKSSGDAEDNEYLQKKYPGLITFSHFLPNQKTLPDWKDPFSDTFDRKWLDHPVPEISAKFAKVSGSAIIDEQIRSILPSVCDSFEGRHLHIFGHSHRPKDFVFDGIRYVHNPLGKPAEREMNMVSNEVDFQLVWDCTKSFSSSDTDKNHMSYLGALGEIPGERVIRFWEEKGGGKKLLARNMKHRRLRKRLEVKRMIRAANAKEKSFGSTNK